MSKQWPRVPLGEVATPTQRAEAPLTGTTYRQIGVKLWGEGAYERETIDGSQTKYAQLFRAEEGDIIVNKIWARNGSVAVVPKSLTGCYGSGEFPMFTPNRERLEPRWIHWHTKTRSFWAQCDEKSRGTSGKNRIKPEQFLRVEIPLPPRAEQQRIVAQVEELADHIQNARSLRQQAAEEVNKLHRQLFARVWTEANTCCSPVPLSTIAAVIDPQPDHRTPAEVSDGLPYVSIANIELDGEVDIVSARKIAEDAVNKQEAAFRLSSGDIVLGKIGTVGAARPIKVRSRFALSANVVLVQPDRHKVDERFLLALLSSSQLAEQLTTGTNTTAQAAFGIKGSERESDRTPVVTQLARPSVPR